MDADAYELCCFVTHEGTSTEAAIWRDKQRKRAVLAFRGTSDVKDLITDVNLLQRPFEGDKDGKAKAGDERRVHAGFFESAASVNRRVKELLVTACAGKPKEWDVLVTGHSLGGALATMFAAEIARGVDLSRGFQEYDSSWYAQASSFFDIGQSKLGLKQKPIELGAVRCYTFGAPRVGNAAFAEFFEEAFEGREAFRIVNEDDLIARLPRHGNAAGAVLDYEHCGRTVLIAEGAGDVADGFWVEGESDASACPIRGVSPLTNPFSSGTILGDVSGKATDTLSAAWEQLEKDGGLAAAAGELGKGMGSVASRLQSANPLEAVSLLGLDQEYVKSEMKMLDSLRKGTAVENHLEPSYFVAMTSALDAALAGSDDGEGEAPE